MKKLILLLIALPLFLTNCTKENQPDSPTNTVTTYKGEFSTGSIDATLVSKPALVVVTENSSTDWSMSLEVLGQTPQVLTATKNGQVILFTNQTYLGGSVQGKGELNGVQLRFSVDSIGTTTAANIGVFIGEKQ